MSIFLPATIGPVEEQQERLSFDEYRWMLSATKTPRDALIMEVLYGTGLRIGELLRVEARDVRLVKTGRGWKKEMVVHRLKKRAVVVDTIPLKDDIARLLQFYIDSEGRTPARKVFAITARRVQQIFADVSARTVGRRVTPHALRGLFIKENIDAGVPVAAVAKLVGHEDIRTTLKAYYYLTRDDKFRIIDEMRR